MAVATDAAWVQDQVSSAVGQGWRLGSVWDRLGLWLGVAPRGDMPSVIIREIFAFRILGKFLQSKFLGKYVQSEWLGHYAQWG